MLDYSDFTILLARQRSGTNPVRSVLESHRDVFCFNEVFNFGDRDADEPLLRRTNFFTFLVAYAQGDLTRVFPDRHETVFLDFLEYLRCFTPKAHKVIDVKLNTTHFLTEPWAENATSPYLYDLIVRHELRVLHLTRRNYLRSVLSSEKAWHSGRYTVERTQPPYEDVTRAVDVAFLLRELEKCAEEDEAVAHRFASYPLYLAFDYADVFARGGASGEFLDTVASWLAIPSSFRRTPRYRKQSSLPLRETIANYDEVERALRGTRFEYCLDDEPVYARRELVRH
jgi:hypothetical protein